MRKDRRNNPKETYLFALLVLIAISISSPGSTRGDSASEIRSQGHKFPKNALRHHTGSKVVEQECQRPVGFP